MLFLYLLPPHTESSETAFPLDLMLPSKPLRAVTRRAAVRCQLLGWPGCCFHQALFGGSLFSREAKQQSPALARSTVCLCVTQADFEEAGRSACCSQLVESGETAHGQLAKTDNPVC